MVVLVASGFISGTRRHHCDPSGPHQSPQVQLQSRRSTLGTGRLGHSMCIPVKTFVEKLSLFITFFIYIYIYRERERERFNSDSFKVAWLNALAYLFSHIHHPQGTSAQKLSKYCIGGHYLGASSPGRSWGCRNRDRDQHGPP